MPLPRVLARVNRRVTNPVLGKLAFGVRPFALVEHHGRRSGRPYRTPVFAFDQGPPADVVVIALTYGEDVDWLRNAQASGGCLLIRGRRVLRLGPPDVVGPEEGGPALPAAVRGALLVLNVGSFARFPVLERTG